MVSQMLLVPLLSLLSLVPPGNSQNDSVPHEIIDISSSTINFSVKLLKALSSSPGENIIISPSSIDVLLSLLHQGAGGTTGDQLSRILERDREATKFSYSTILPSLSLQSQGGVLAKMATRMYIQKDFPVKENFLRLADEDFASDIVDLDFSQPDSAGVMNNWVANITQGRITDVVKQDQLGLSTGMVLVNAVYFDGLWQNPFSPGYVGKSQFYPSRNKVSEGITYMAQSKPLIGGEDEQIGIKWVELPYKGNVFSMYIFLPVQEHGLDDALRKLTGKDIHKIFTDKKERYVRLKLPKFSLRQTLPLVPMLQKLGLQDMFNENANFSGITASPIRVSNVLHECVLSVDEAGTQATAASSLFATTLSLQYYQQKELKFFVTEPFLLAIIDKVHRMPLFIAKVVNPR